MSRYTQTIAELLQQRGDIRAQGAQMSGQIWGNYLGGVGNQLLSYGLNKLEADEVKKVQLKKQQAFSAAMQTWDSKDPKGSTLRLAKVIGPDDAMKFGSSMLAFESVIQKNAKGELPTIDELKFSISGAHTLYKNNPEEFAKQYPMLRQELGPGIKHHLKYDLPEEPTPEVLEGLGQLATSWTKPETGSKVVGDALIGPDGKVIYQAPSKPEKTLEDLTAEARARALGTASVNPPGGEGTWEEAIGPDGKPVLFNARTGQTRAYPAGVTPKQGGKERAVTGAERQVLAYYNRAKQAIDDISPLEEKVAKYGYAEQQQLENAPNVLKTTEQKQYRQAQRAFTEARLRKESGAAIPDAEYLNDARTYFAQPGDDAPTLEQKARARAIVLQGLQYSSGRAYEEYYGEPAPKPADQRGAAPAQPKATHRWTPNGVVPIGAK